MQLAGFTGDDVSSCCVPVYCRQAHRKCSVSHGRYDVEDVSENWVLTGSRVDDICYVSIQRLWSQTSDNCGVLAVAVHRQVIDIFFRAAEAHPHGSELFGKLITVIPLSQTAFGGRYPSCASVQSLISCRCADIRDPPVASC